MQCTGNDSTIYSTQKNVSCNSRSYMELLYSGVDTLLVLAESSVTLFLALLLSFSIPLHLAGTAGQADGCNFEPIQTLASGEVLQ